MTLTSFASAPPAPGQPEAETLGATPAPLFQLLLSLWTVLGHSPLGRLLFHASLLTLKAFFPTLAPHIQEWLASGVHPHLIALNVWTPDPEEATEFILGTELEHLKLNNPAQVSAEARRLLDRYQHLETGGWACEGVDPTTGEKMGWGCFKPRNPRVITEAQGFGPDCHTGTQAKSPAKTKTKTIKYEAPKGVEKRVFCLSVSWEVGLLIAIRAGLEQRYRARMGEAQPWQEDQGFWPWAIDQGIDQVYVEGAKKAGCLLSQGLLAIGLDGVENWSASRSDASQARQLKADIQALTVNSPNIVIAHDQDTQPRTVANVTRATQSFAHALEQTVGCVVTVALWSPALGKGIDDVWANGGDVIYLITHTFPWQGLKQLRQHFALPQADLILNYTSLENATLPDGDLALRSPKGSGKTRWAAATLKETAKVIALNFRTSLCEDQATRLGLDFLNESDMGAGHIINRHGEPTQRITLNLDSLLKLKHQIDQGHWDGCTIFLDEFEQALRHLLLGSTVRKGGKLPLILETFESLLQRAGRVIAADADLSQESVQYLSTLTGRPLTTVINFTNQGGYNFTQFTTKAGLIARLQAAALEGKRLFIATTSKRETKRLATLLDRIGLENKYLVRNSETSGQTRDYSADPSQWLLNHPDIQIVICSPTDATGISIECLNRFDIVALIGLPGAQTDADLSQMLSRVRQQIQRWIWTAAKGGRSSTVSSSTHALEVKSALQRQTDTASQVLSHSLTLEHDAHLEAWANLEANTNYAMQNLETAFYCRLHLEGNRKLATITLDGAELKTELTKIAALVKQLEHEAILNAPRLTEAEANVLERKEVLSPEEATQLHRFKLCQFYRIPAEALTLEDIERDKQGHTRTTIINLETYLNLERAKTLDLEAIQRGHHLLEHQHCHAASSLFLHTLNLSPFLLPSAEWTTKDPHLLALHAYVMNHLEQARDAGLKIRASDGPQAVLGIILSKLGLKTKRFGEPHRHADGSLLYRYKLDPDHLKRIEDTLQRRGYAHWSMAHTPDFSSQDQKTSLGCQDTQTQQQQQFQPTETTTQPYGLLEWEGETWYVGYRGHLTLVCPLTADLKDPDCWLILPTA